MSAKRSGLGRGLDSLLPRSEEPEKDIEQVSLGLLSPSPLQPRKHIDPEAIAELSASIAEKGVLQPILVRPGGNGFEIVAGERRYRAAQQAGLLTVPVIVRDLGDREALEIAIIENLQRENLSPLEEALAFNELMEFGLSQEEVAKAVGKSRSAVANTVRLLALSAGAQTALANKTITAGHGRAILAQPEQDQVWALEAIIADHLTVRQAELLKRDPFERPGNGSIEGEGLLVADFEPPKKSVYEDIQEDLARHIGTKVKITGKDKGRVELHFYSPEELQRLLEFLGYQA